LVSDWFGPASFRSTRALSRSVAQRSRFASRCAASAVPAVLPAGCGLAKRGEMRVLLHERLAQG